MIKFDTMDEFPPSSDHAIVIRRKRTKRRRRPSSSAGTSSGISTSSEENEDMAHCLILLARGDSPSPPPPEPPLTAAAGELGPTCDGRVGIYVYECRTCNRTFPSFQALGGHRASHKRPKPTPMAVERIEYDKRIPKINSTPQHSKICQINDQIRLRIHECSICGSEFASGQALGDHMRRHRAVAGPPPIAVDDDICSDDTTEKHGSVLPLDLDLNLPAAQELDKMSQFPAAQQRRMTTPEAALVDCHY